MQFSFKKEIKKLGINGSFLVIKGMKNKKESEEFNNLLEKFFSENSEKETEKPLQKTNILNGFKELHEKIGLTGKKYISSPEKLSHYFIENQNIPRINLIVDIYNFISLKSSLALGAHDINYIVGNVELKITKGTEIFLPLGYNKVKKVPIGHYAYIDDANEIICDLEVRQVEKTKITLKSTDCFFIIQGNEKVDKEYLHKYTKELIDLIIKYCGGSVEVLYSSCEKKL